MSVLAALSALGCCSLAALAPAPAPPTGGVPVTQLSFAGPGVEVAGTDDVWRALPQGGRVKTGERLRTGSEGAARLEFPFMGLTVGPDSELAIPAGMVLSIGLVRGRVELGSERGEIIKLTTPELELRGQGRVVVRRADDTTFVIATTGSFRVQARGKSVNVARGQGLRVRAGQAAGQPEPLPATPNGLKPGSDPLYFKPGEPIQLEWNGVGTAYHLQVLGVDADVVVINRDVGPSPYTLTIPWPGTFRWRVALRDEHGLESLPSDEGLVCLLEK
jgi:hypothetical protein